MSSSAPTPAERAIAAVIYAPIGLGAQLVDDVPAVLNKARQQIVFARFIGKMAVDQGVKELRGLLASADPGGEADPHGSSDSAEADDAPDETLVTMASVAEPPAEEALDSDELALPDYDQLPASHIVSKLGGLTPIELDAIEAYELAHRHRRTVLGKIAQLKAA